MESDKTFKQQNRSQEQCHNKNESALKLSARIILKDDHEEEGDDCVGKMFAS